jgi:polyisoprenoid-binding protein YceI
MKKTTLLFALVFAGTSIFAQKRVTTSGTISFDATTSMDALPRAENKTVVAALDPKTGGIAFEAIIKSFSFANPMMQGHFNSVNWMDSDKFPTAIFKGKITNLAAVNFAKDGTYAADVSGDLTIHGITKQVTTKGSIVVSGKSIAASGNFTVKVDDYGITGKAIEAGKVNKEPKVTVSVTFN